MKKLLLTGVALLTVISLVACSNKNSENSSSKESTSKSSSVIQKEKVDNSKYNPAISELKSKIDPENKGGWDYKITNDVSNEVFSGGTTISITPTEQSGIDNLKKIYGESGSSEDAGAQVAKLALQQAVSNAAKKLPDENSEITLGYPTGSDNSVLLAASTKSKDIIPLKQ